MPFPDCWVPLPADTDFGIYNLPWGCFSTAEREARPGLAIGDHIIDLRALAERGYFQPWLPEVPPFQGPTLNALIGLGQSVTRRIRQQVQADLCQRHSPLYAHPQVLVPRATARLHLPVHIGDYTDFYASREHATNVGKLFRDPDQALLPNWLHLPVAYHGRASSVVVSGTPIRRPQGQFKPAGSEQPVFGLTQQLDFELELGCIIGRDNALGQPVGVEQATEHIFGLVLVNDWSARDIQRWEYQPLGPFLGKNFATSISPWIVALEALQPYAVAGPAQEPLPLPYLRATAPAHYDIRLSVELATSGGGSATLCTVNARRLYWSTAQQVAHHTVNGCPLRVGDLLASGTISGPEPGSYGSLLEITEGGRRPLRLPDGSRRTFLENGDAVRLRGVAGAGQQRVGFGEVHGTIVSGTDPV